MATTSAPAVPLKSPDVTYKVPQGKCTTAGYVVFSGVVIIALYAIGMMIAIWSSNDYTMLDQYFILVFCITAIAMVFPERDTPQDIVPGGHCWQKSWRHFYNLTILFTVSMFLVFVAVTILMLNGIFPDSIQPEKTAVIGITAGLCLGLALVIFKGTEGVTYMFTFWLLLMVIVWMNLPLPYAWMNIVGGLMSALFISWILMSGLSCIAKTQELHEHMAVGLAFVWAIYSRFADWRYYYTLPFREYGTIFAVGFAAGVGRALWRWFYLKVILKRCDQQDSTSIALTTAASDLSESDEDEKEMEIEEAIQMAGLYNSTKRGLAGRR